MFKKNFERICFEKGLKPTIVVRNIGLAAATYTCWTDESIPRKGTLKKLAEYLNVTEEELLRDDSNTTNPDSNITESNDNDRSLKTLRKKDGSWLQLLGGQNGAETQKSTAREGDASMDSKVNYLLNIFLKCDEEGRDRMIQDAEKILLDRLKGQ